MATKKKRLRALFSNVLATFCSNLRHLSQGAKYRSTIAVWQSVEGVFVLVPQVGRGVMIMLFNGAQSMSLLVR